MRFFLKIWLLLRIIKIELCAVYWVQSNGSIRSAVVEVFGGGKDGRGVDVHAMSHHTENAYWYMYYCCADKSFSKRAQSARSCAGTDIHVVFVDH